MKTNPATSVTEFRSIVVGGCLALLALLLSLAVSAVATYEEVKRDTVQIVSDRAEKPAAKAPLEWKSGSSLARAEAVSAAR